VSTVDAYAGFITAGDTIAGWVDPVVDFLLTVGPGCLAVAACIAAWRIARALRNAAHRLQELLELRHTPAAPDNTAGGDNELLATCRRIDAEPLADPDATRRLINYLRDTGEETP
jgi:hypothetical protein